MVKAELSCLEDRAEQQHRILRIGNLHDPAALGDQSLDKIRGRRTRGDDGFALRPGQGCAHFGVELSAANGLQLLIPRGFLHGFVTLAAETEVIYKVSDYFDPALDAGLHWRDPAFAIDWPVAEDAAILSAKDRAAPVSADIVSPFAHVGGGGAA